MKLTRNAYVYAGSGPHRPEDISESLLCFLQNDNTEATWQFVGTADITVNLLSPGEMAAKQIETLQAQRDEAGKQFAATVRRIDEQLSKLQAIGCDVGAA